MGGKGSIITLKGDRKADDEYVYLGHKGQIVRARYTLV